MPAISNSCRTSLTACCGSNKISGIPLVGTSPGHASAKASSLVLAAEAEVHLRAVDEMPLQIRRIIQIYVEAD